MLPNADQRNHKTILSFKEKIAQLLVNPVLQKNTAARCNPVLALTIACEAARNLSDTLGVIDKAHALVRNKPRKSNMNKEQDIPCYLCKLRGFHSKTQFGCAVRKAGFHVELFTAFHCKDGLKGNMKTLLDMIKASEIAGKNRRKKSTYMGSLESL
jgi:hypothetical protein